LTAGVTPVSSISREHRLVKFETPTEPTLPSLLQVDHGAERLDVAADAGFGQWMR
jgi:hypothetical protein